jgi:hypothetical protein
VEVLLNGLWLLVAFAGAHLLLRSQLRRSSMVPRWPVVLSLICAVVLLYPAISCSDDLHPLQATIEDVAASRRQMFAAGVQAGGPLVLACPRAAAVLASSPLIFLYPVQIHLAKGRPLATVFTVAGLRAPPCMSL